jgi:hypothetical protein
MRSVLVAAFAVLLFCPGLPGEREMSPTIHEIKAKHAARLLAIPGVKSVGIGRDSQGHEVIVIGLDRPRPDTQAQLPAELEGHPVRVEVVGRIKAQ